jgi:hypothetical protein
VTGPRFEISFLVGTQWELPEAISPQGAVLSSSFLGSVRPDWHSAQTEASYVFFPVRWTRLSRRSRRSLVGPDGSASSFPSHKGKTSGPRPKKDAELLPQGKVLGHECGPRAKQGDEGPEKESNQAEHAGRIRAEKESEGACPGGRRNFNRLRHRRSHSASL